MTTTNDRLLPGLYIIKQFKAEKGVDHLAILDIGNRLLLPDVPPGYESMVVHLPPAGLRKDPLSATGTWDVMFVVPDEKGARERLVKCLEKPEYNLFDNNCEHFVNYVVSGVKHSPQLRSAVGAVAAVGVVAFVATALSSD